MTRFPKGIFPAMKPGKGSATMDPDPVSQDLWEKSLQCMKEYGEVLEEPFALKDAPNSPPCVSESSSFKG